MHLFFINFEFVFGFFFSVRNAANLDEELNLNSTFLECKLQKVTLVLRSNRPQVGLSSVDIMALKRLDNSNQRCGNKYYASHSVSHHIILIAFLAGKVIYEKKVSIFSYTCQGTFQSLRVLNRERLYY